MKCKQCGTEFTGNYCPECGAKNEELYPQIVPKKLNKRNKRPGVKKPFYKKWWFYVILLLFISNVIRAITSGNKKTETKDYEEIIDNYSRSVFRLCKSDSRAERE